MPGLKPCAYCGCEMEIMRNELKYRTTFSMEGGSLGNVSHAGISIYRLPDRASRDRCLQYEGLMKKITGVLRIAVDIDCPGCGETIDLTQISRFADDGYILKEVLDGPRLGCDDLGDTVICPECKTEFLIGEIAW